MTQHKTRPQYLGLILLLIKLGPKLIPLFSKLFKALFGLKTVGATLSVGFYSYLLTWEMGISIVIFIFVHEYGHLWAMKKCGLKTKGIYLIPGFGGAAIAAEKFRSGRNEAYIALMGPVFGLFLSIPLIGMYFLTDNLLYMAIMSLVIFINLINLFPINPLDGGRIIKSLVYSVSESWGFIAMLISFAVAAYLAFHFDFGLLAIIALIGLYETITDYGLRDTLEEFWKTTKRFFVGWLFYMIYFKSLFTAPDPNKSSAENIIPGVSAIDLTDPFVWIGLVVLVVLPIFLCIDIYKSTNKKIITYPFVVLLDAIIGIKKLLHLKHKDLIRIDNHEQMSKSQLSFYSVAYLAIIAIHIPLVVYAAKISNFGIVADLLK